MMKTIGSLFAGIGGFDLGFERAGFKTTWACEIDQKAQAVLRLRFPEAKLHDDVCQIGVDNLEPVDIVTFGSPCQDLSVAGKRAGLAGEGAVCSMRQLELFGSFVSDMASPTLQSGKTSQAHSAATPGETLLRSSTRWQTSGRVTLRGESWTAASSESPSVAVECSLSRILEANAQSKYWLSPKACAGILRRADKRGKDLPPALKTALEQVAGSLQGGGNAYALTCHSVKGGDPTTDNYAYRLGEPTYAPERSACLETTNHDYSRADGFTAIPYTLEVRGRDGESVLEYRQDGTANALRTPGGGRGGMGVGAVAFNWQEGPGGSLGMSDADTGGSPPVRVHQTLATLDASVVRRLTPVECCRLQGFPDDWNSEGINPKGKRFQMADGPRYRQLGNAVTVNVANWLANNLMRVYNQNQE